MAAPDDRPLPLTVEERRVLSLSARGLSVIEVAGALGTRAAVVHVWLASAMEKLGARSKLEAIIIAARRGEIDPSP
jgi:two-component system response regulator DesR